MTTCGVEANFTGRYFWTRRYSVSRRGRRREDDLRLHQESREWGVPRGAGETDGVVKYPLW